MLRRRLVAGAVLAAAALGSFPSVAVAGDSTSAVQCVGAVCDLHVQSAGAPGRPAAAPAGAASHGGGSNEPHCLYQLSDFRPPPTDSADAHPGRPGAWYLMSCLPALSFGAGLPMPVWLEGGSGLPSPAVLALQAERQLVLPEPRIHANPPPDGEQLVNVPTWLWLDPGSWGRRSATASVPGESVTATATPARVVWSLGDGASVTCRGPGSVYRPGADPKSASPDCGHTYRRSSASQPGGAYPVSAMVTWDVSWSGGGQSGAFPGLTSTGRSAFRVAESQAVVTS